MYSDLGRTSIPPEHLLRALLFQVLYSVRSERQLMEQVDYNLLSRWFVGLGMDDPIWVPTVFTKIRDRLLDNETIQHFFQTVLAQARHQGQRHLLDEVASSTLNLTEDATAMSAFL
jgi:transposase